MEDNFSKECNFKFYSICLEFFFYLALFFKSSSTPFDLGPFLISQRIDEEKKTPAKTPVIAPVILFSWFYSCQ